MIPVLAFLLLAVADPQPAAPADEPAVADAAIQAADTAASGAAASPSAVPRREPARILALDPRLEAYEQFKSLYDTARFEEALPYAHRVVELSESDADRDYELPIAYNNLGATLYQLGDYPGATESYRMSLELLEATQGISSRRMIVPLAGLGAVHAALDQHAIAAALFDRALAVSRRADGLFNQAQLPLIEQVADSRYAIEDYQGVERERLYALKIAEQNYGYSDERTLPAIMKLAGFYESLRQYIAARVMYLRARDISMKESGGFSPMAVKSLVGIARSHRLQYTMDPQTLESQLPSRDPITGEVVRYNGEVVGRIYKDSRVPPPSADRGGLRAVQQALELLRAAADPPRDLLAETLIELGDWYQSTSRPTLSLPYYAEASDLLAAEAEAGGANPLLAPRMVYYRPPIASSRGLNTLTGQYIIRKTVFRLSVSEKGEPQDITVVETNMSEGQLSQSRRAISRAIYSPRFVDGRAARTEDISFTADWYEEYTPDPEAATAAAPVSSTSP